MATQKPLGRVRLILVLGGLIMGLVVMEVALHIVGYSFPIWYSNDPYTGYSLRPGMTGWYTREGLSYVRINSDGMRDREHTRTKPPDTIRIAILGDSFAEAMHIPAENTFWSLMESKLKGCTGKNVEVLNFGVSGYGTALEFITLQRKVWDYQPDVVILAFLSLNDVSDNSRELKRTDKVPYFVYRDGRLTLDDSFLRTDAYQNSNSSLYRLGRWIRDRSRVVQAVHNFQYVVKSWLDDRRERKRLAAQKATIQTNGLIATESAAPGNTDFEIYSEPHAPVWIDAWQVTEGLIRITRDDVTSHGAGFLLVTLSNDVQVLPNPMARENFLKSVGGTDLFYPEKRIIALGQREGFDVLTLAPRMQAYAEQHQVYLHGFGANIGNGHWNSTGHAVAADLMTPKVCELLRTRPNL